VIFDKVFLKNLIKLLYISLVDRDLLSGKSLNKNSSNTTVKGQTINKSKNEIYSRN
jgi:hypothetical protein